MPSRKGDRANGRRFLAPRSYCSSCGRAFLSDVRRPCRCGATARTFNRSVTDRVQSEDRIS